MTTTSLDFWLGPYITLDSVLHTLILQTQVPSTQIMSITTQSLSMEIELSMAWESQLQQRQLKSSSCWFHDDTFQVSALSKTQRHRSLAFQRKPWAASVLTELQSLGALKVTWMLCGKSLLSSKLRLLIGKVWGTLSTNEFCTKIILRFHFTNGLSLFWWQILHTVNIGIRAQAGWKTECCVSEDFWQQRSSHVMCSKRQSQQQHLPSTDEFDWWSWCECFDRRKKSKKYLRNHAWWECFAPHTYWTGKTFQRTFRGYLIAGWKVYK